MENDMKALNDLVEEYTNKETELMKVENELATRDEQFANFITTQKRLKEQKEVLVDLIKSEMKDRGLREHLAGNIYLKLTPLGKYKAEDINEVPDDLCKIVKTLDNKKITAYKEIHGELPVGVESLGDRLVIRVRDKEEE